MQSVVNDIFFSVYQYFGFGLVFAVVCMLALPEIKRLGIKSSLQQVCVSAGNEEKRLCEKLHGRCLGNARR